MDWLGSVDEKIFMLNDSFSSELRNQISCLDRSELSLDSLNKNLVLLIGYAIRGTNELELVLALFDVMGCKESTHEKAIQKVCNVLWMFGVQVPGGTSVWDNLCVLVNKFANKNVISIATLATSLELNLLTCSGILGSASSDEKRIAQKLIKLNTNVMYRQQKYNMMEEETEGYSKLIVLATSLPAYPSDISRHIQQFISIIGLMDLDPNRVLDIVLDAFEMNVWNMSYVVLIRKLNFSNDYITEIIGSKLTHYHLKSLLESKTDNSKSSGNNQGAAAASVLESPANIGNAETVKHDGQSKYNDLLDYSACTSQKLCEVIAVLISSRILTVEGVLPFLEPTLQKTAEQFHLDVAIKKDAVRNIPVVSLGTKSLSTEAEPIVPSVDVNAKDDSLKPTWAYPDESEHFGSAPYAGGQQILGVLSALLSIRCWDAAELIIVLLEAEGIDAFSVQSCRESMCNLLSWIITDVYDNMCSLKHFSLAKPVTEATVNQVNIDENRENMLIAVAKSTPQTLNQISAIPATVSSLRNFPQLISKFIFRLRANLAYSPLLFQKLCRILQLHINMVKVNAQEPIDENDAILADLEQLGPVIDILVQVLLPALTCVESGKPGYVLSRQVWHVLVSLPYQLRFEMYSKWHGVGTGKHGLEDPNKSVECCHAEMVATQNIRALLKRMTADNAKIIGKKLARYFPTCPLVVYEHLLKQICAYENLIPIIADSMKYASELGFDCMAFCIVNKLRENSSSKSAEPKLKEDDTNVATWFANLCKFTGMFYMKYPSTELNGLFDYILQQTSCGNAVELLLLKELLSIMGGCDSVVDVSQQQLLSLSGGKTLKFITMSGGVVDTSAASKSKVFLRQKLFSSTCAFPLFLNLSQIRSCVLHTGNVKSLKLVSHLHGIAQDTFMQYTDYLFGSDLTLLQKFENCLPTVSTMVGDFSLQVSALFQLVRPLVRAAMSHGSDPSCAPEWLQKWHPFGEQLKTALSTTTEFVACSKFISYELFVLFWSFSIGELEFPKDKYRQEISRLLKTKKDLENKLNQEKKLSRVASSKAVLDELKQIEKLVKSLEDEELAQERHVQTIGDMLKNAAKTFFPLNTNSSQYHATFALLQMLVQQRMFLSPADALLSVKFFLVLQEMGVPGFPGLYFFDRLFASIPPLIYQSTEGEASCMGYAMSACISSIQKLYFSKEAFEAFFDPKSIHANGAAHVSNSSLNETTLKLQSESEFVSDASNGEQPSYSCEFFKSWCLDWHENVVHVIKSCLQSQEYIHIRSALIFLDKVVETFPFFMSGGAILQECVDHLEKTEVDRNDLRLMSRSLRAVLAKQSAKWIDNNGNVIDSKQLLPVRKVTSSSEVVSEPDSTGNITETIRATTVTPEVENSSKRARIDAAPTSITGSTEAISGQSKSEKDVRNRILASRGRNTANNENPIAPSSTVRNPERGNDAPRIDSFKTVANSIGNDRSSANSQDSLRLKRKSGDLTEVTEAASLKAYDSNPKQSPIDSRDGKDFRVENSGRSYRDNWQARDPRDGHGDSRNPRDFRESRESRRDNFDHKNHRDFTDSRMSREYRDDRDFRDSQSYNSRNDDYASQMLKDPRSRIIDSRGDNRSSNSAKDPSDRRNTESRDRVFNRRY